MYNLVNCGKHCYVYKEIYNNNNGNINKYARVSYSAKHLTIKCNLCIEYHFSVAALLWPSFSAAVQNTRDLDGTNSTGNFRQFIDLFNNQKAHVRLTLCKEIGLKLMPYS